MPLQSENKSSDIRKAKLAGTELLSCLPQTRGKLTANVCLADSTWFRVGGPAEILFKPEDADDLSAFLAGCPENVPVTVMGVASNTLIRDGGIPGVVIKLSPNFSTIKVDDTKISAGAAAIDLNVAKAAQLSGIAGLEFLCGIPGTIGGGLRMNAGAYGREFKHIVKSVTALDRFGRKHCLSPDQMGFSYRHCSVPNDWIFLDATLEGKSEDPALVRERMSKIQEDRAASQPIREKTGGSTFANPENDHECRKAWQLIDAAGCRGLKIGQAMVSEKHCNFLMNIGHATAADIEELGEEVRRRVKEKTGIDLRWEIRRIGVKKPQT